MGWDSQAMDQLMGVKLVAHCISSVSRVSSRFSTVGPMAFSSSDEISKAEVLRIAPSPVIDSMILTRVSGMFSISGL